MSTPVPVEIVSVPTPPLMDVVAGAAAQGVVAVLPEQLVVAAQPGQRVVGIVADDDVVQALPVPARPCRVNVRFSTFSLAATFRLG